MFNFNFLLRLIVLSIILSNFSSFSINAQSIDLNAFESELNTIQDSAEIVGMSIALLENREIIYTNTFGHKNNKSQEKNDNNTIFEAASLTKPIAAYCALKLIEENKLELDKPLSEYLKYEDAAHDDRYKLITARHVLTHNSGFPNWRKDRKLPKINLKFKPGEKFSYSGEGFVYLQKVMEKITKKDLNEIANQFLFEPLEMNRSALVFHDSLNFATGHNKENKPVRKFRPDNPNAAYSMHTNAGDYIKFMKELIDPAYIRKGTLEMMFNYETTMHFNEPSLGWGLGVGINEIGNQKYAWHWGDNGNFKAFFILSLEEGTGLVFFVNSYNGLSIVRRLIDLTFSNPQIMEKWDDYPQF